jgi:predicted enzyme related to lactoylglutathione lyase
METGSPSLVEGIKETYFFTKGGALYGCFFLTEEPKPAETSISHIGPHTVFSVKDIEESLDLIEKSGGKTHARKTSFGPFGGFIARFIDTEGNIMGLYSLN